jgi:hypothetical protein
MKGLAVNNRTSTLLPLAFTAAALALSACSFEAGPTVSGEKLAEAAADALEGEIGSRPEVDCGDEDIIAEEDKEVDCTVTDPATGDEYDATVAFTGVDGDKWNIEVSVPGAQNGGSTEEASQGPDEEAGDQGGSAGTISAADLASAAADALEEQVGSRPEIDCGEVDIVPEEGRTVYCTLIDGGAEYETTVTFASVDGEQWSIDVQVAPEPK